MPKDSRLVYSTESGRIRFDHKMLSSINPDDSVCNIRLEKKGRGGKEVTLIWNVPGGQEELKLVAKAIKKKLGTGGTAKNGQIVIQGNYVELVLIFLKQRGFRVNKAGG